MAEEMGVIMSSNLGASHWCGELGVSTVLALFDLDRQKWF